MATNIQDTLAERKKTHGDFSINATVSQALKTVLRGNKGWQQFRADQCEALEVICAKMARIVTGNENEPDHWHDIAGYATLVENRLTKEQATELSNHAGLPNLMRPNS